MMHGHEKSEPRNSSDFGPIFAGKFQFSARATRTWDASVLAEPFPPSGESSQMRVYPQTAHSRHLDFGVD